MFNDQPGKLIRTSVRLDHPKGGPLVGGGFGRVGGGAGRPRGRVGGFSLVPNEPEKLTEQEADGEAVGVRVDLGGFEVRIRHGFFFLFMRSETER